MPVNNLIAEKMGGFVAVYIFFAIITVVIMALVAVIAKNHFDQSHS